MDKIYYLLSGLYGDELHDFLLGYNGMNDTNLFNIIFLMLLIISAGLVPWLYYKGIDRATWSSRGKWGLVLLANAIIVFLVNVVWVNCLGDMMYDAGGEELSIRFINTIGFGFASAILGSILFFLSSLLWKLRSTNCSSTPF